MLKLVQVAEQEEAVYHTPGAAEFLDLSVRQTDSEAAKCVMCFLSVFMAPVFVKRHPKVEA